jgi:hypothetical protein
MLERGWLEKQIETERTNQSELSPFLRQALGLCSASAESGDHPHESQLQFGNGVNDRSGAEMTPAGVSV